MSEQRFIFLAQIDVLFQACALLEQLVHRFIRSRESSLSYLPEDVVVTNSRHELHLIRVKLFS